VNVVTTVVHFLKVKWFDPTVGARMLLQMRESCDLFGHVARSLMQGKNEDAGELRREFNRLGILRKRNINKQ